MPKANFYLLKHNTQDAKHGLACRLAEQQYKQGQRVYLHTNNADHSAALDQWLWQYSPESFLPHTQHNDALAPQVAILIGHGQAPPADIDCILNLSDQPLPATCITAAVAEFILNEETNKARGRQLWQQYKQRGWQLQHHTL